MNYKKSYIKSKEAREILNCTRANISYLCKQGILKSEKRGRDLQIEKSSVLEYLKKRRLKSGHVRIFSSIGFKFLEFNCLPDFFYYIRKNGGSAKILLKEKGYILIFDDDDM